MKKTITYYSWRAMLDRCTNPKRKTWKNYGGRGISVTPRWLTYENFVADMGERPSKELTIDRIDNDKGYELENCRWATKSTQTKNHRMVGRYEGLVVNGDRKSFRDWEKLSPVSRVSIRKRIISGLSVEEALSKQPTRSRKVSLSEREEARKLFDSGSTVAEVARKFNVDPSSMWRIIHPNRKRK